MRANCDPYRHSNLNGDLHSQSYHNLHPQPNTNCDYHPHLHSVAHPDRHPQSDVNWHADGLTQSDGLAKSDKLPEPDSERDLQSIAHGIAQPDAERIADGLTQSDRLSESDPECDLQSIAHGIAQPDAERIADAIREPITQSLPDTTTSGLYSRLGWRHNWLQHAGRAAWVGTIARAWALSGSTLSSASRR